MTTKNNASLRNADRHRVRCAGWTIPRDLVEGLRELALTLGVTQSSLAEKAVRNLLRHAGRARP